MNSHPSSHQSAVTSCAERAWRTRDTAALHQALLLLQPRIAGITLGICSDPDAARDAAQETYVKALAGFSRLRDPAAFVRWVDQIATRTSIDTVRWQRASRADPQDANETISERRVDSATQLVVRAALYDLSPAQRAVVVLYYWLDLSMREIGEIVGCDSGTVKSRLSRARDRLAESLREDVANG